MVKKRLPWNYWLMALLALSSTTPATAEVISWSYDREIVGTPRVSNAGHRVAIWASMTATRIEDEREILIIDYKALVVQRLKKSRTQPEIYPLRQPPGNVAPSTFTDTSIAQSMAELLGSFRVVTTPLRETIGVYPCQRKDVLYGLSLRASGMVAPPLTERYGQRFSETVEQHWLTGKITGLEVLRKIAAVHRAIFNANPLLRRLDPLGLLESLDGFSVKVIRKEPHAAPIIDTLQTISLAAEDPALFAIPRTKNTDRER